MRLIDWIKASIAVAILLDLLIILTVIDRRCSDYGYNTIIKGIQVYCYKGTTIVSLKDLKYAEKLERSKHVGR